MFPAAALANTSGDRAKHKQKHTVQGHDSVTKKYTQAHSLNTHTERERGENSTNATHRV